MILIATKVTEQERWLNTVKTRALRRHRMMSRREREVVEKAYGSESERAWDLADGLLGLVDKADARYKRVKQCQMIEEVLL